MRRSRVFAAVFFAAFVGWFVGQMGVSAALAQPIYSHLSVFAEVLGHVQSRYVDDTDEHTLVEAAIRGMLTELDPHSVYMDPEQYAAMRDDTRGEYVGVGIMIERTGAGIVVKQVFDGGPALRAGVLQDDLLVSIDGESALEATTDDVVRRLRGRRGEAVVVVVRRTGDDGKTTDVELTLIRDVIHVDAVASSQPLPGIGVVRVRQFQADVSDDVRGAIDRLQADHGAPLVGLVLDLRGNPGGLLSEAIGLSDVFMSEGVIVSTGGRAQASNRWSAQRSSTRFGGPVVVLMDGGSASASEIVAGALQDSGRARVVGAQSYGKGSVQTIIDLSDGGGLKLTISRYYTPSGRSIQGEGITPDFWVAAGEIAEGVPGDVPGADLSSLVDAQLRAAVEVLLTGDTAAASGSSAETAGAPHHETAPDDGGMPDATEEELESESDAAE